MGASQFLRRSQRLYDEPRYPLAILVPAALVFSFLAGFNTPMTDGIYLLRISFQDDDVVILGTLGYCWERLGVEACSPVQAGYQLNSFPDSYQHLLLIIRPWITAILSLQMISFAVILTASGIIISAHFVRTYFARWHVAYCGIAALMQLASFVVDVVFSSVMRSKVAQLQSHPSIRLGVGTWLALVAFVLLCLAILGDAWQFWKRPRHTTQDIEKTTINASTESFACLENGTRQNTVPNQTFPGPDVIDLIPSNDRRSLDQPTIDIIYQSLFVDATEENSTGTESNSPVRIQSPIFSPTSPQHPRAAPINIHNPKMVTPLPNSEIPGAETPGPAAHPLPRIRPLPPLVPLRRQPTSRYAPSSYYTYHSRPTSDSAKTGTSTPTYTAGFLSRTVTMQSNVLPPRSERHASTPSMSTQRSGGDGFQRPHFGQLMSSVSSLSSAWNSIFQKLQTSGTETPPLPHYPISSFRFGGDRFIEGYVSDDARSLPSADGSSVLEVLSDQHHDPGYRTYSMRRAETISSRESYV